MWNRNESNRINRNGYLCVATKTEGTHCWLECIQSYKLSGESICLRIRHRLTSDMTGVLKTHVKGKHDLGAPILGTLDR